MQFFEIYFDADAEKLLLLKDNQDQMSIIQKCKR